MQARAALAFAAGIALTAPFAIHFSGLMLNGTDSVPVGLYRRSGVGSYAVLCLPDGALQTAKEAGLDLSGGSCPNGSIPLLKPLYVASVSRPIEFGEAGFRIGGRFVPNTAPKPVSKTGARLQHYDFGTYREGIFAISDFSRDSYDSRYFGPVGPDTIRYYANPVWTKTESN